MLQGLDRSLDDVTRFQRSARPLQREIPHDATGQSTVVVSGSIHHLCLAVHSLKQSLHNGKRLSTVSIAENNII